MLDEYWAKLHLGVNFGGTNRGMYFTHTLWVLNDAKIEEIKSMWMGHGTVLFGLKIAMFRSPYLNRLKR